MTTYRTGNAIGSADPRDLYDNAENLDELVNSRDKAEHPDRLGVPRKTWHGMEQEHKADQTRRESEFVDAQADKQQRFNLLLANSGYEYLADYAAGIEVTEYNQVLRDASGELWRAAATTNLPYTTDGTGLPEGGAFVAVGDADIRNDLAAGVGAGKGGLLVAGAVIYVDTIADLQALSTDELAGGQAVRVNDQERPGSFVWRSGDYSAEVASDPYSSMWVSPEGEDGSSGAWNRQEEGRLSYYIDESDITGSAAIAFSSGVALFDQNQQYEFEEEIQPATGTQLAAQNVTLENYQEYQSVINHPSTNPAVTGTSYSGVSFKQNKSTPIAGGMSNNHAMLKWRGGDNHKSLFNEFDGQYAMSFGQGAQSLDDRRIKYGKAIGNHASDVQGMFIENIGASYTAIVGNSCDAENGVYHGIRLAGYDSTDSNDLSDAECAGVVGAANVLKGMARGIAPQNASRFFNLSSNFIEDANYAVQLFQGTSPGNYPQMGRIDFTARNVERGIVGEGYSHCTFDFTIDGENATGDLISESSPSDSPGHNRYQGTIRNANGGRAVALRYDYNTIDLNIDGALAAGLVIAGDYNCGQVVVTNCGGSGVAITGNGNNIRIVAAGNLGDNDISVTGQNNSVDVVCGGNLTIGGSGNTVRGTVAGSVSNPGVDNDLSGIRGFSGRGLLQGTTDENGRITAFTNTHPSASSLGYHRVVGIYNGPNPWNVRVQIIASDSVTFTVFDETGSSVANTNVVIRWIY